MNILCVLARSPAPGRGKTRLRADLGDGLTDRLAAAFVGDVLGWDTPEADRVLVAHHGPPGLLPGRWAGEDLVPQVTGDLGRRIDAAVAAAFARGAARVVIIGSDCPTLPRRLLGAAFSGLNTASSTLIPADDGGWIAVGVDRPLRGVLDRVEWSTSRAATQTAAALTADGRPPLLLDRWYDVDEPGDVERLRRDEHLEERAPRTRAVLVADPLHAL